jgi:alkyl hydroperoxide reductase subunit AhpC
MTIQLGETAPDFTVETTEGRLNFYDYLGNHWGSYSHGSAAAAGQGE